MLVFLIQHHIREFTTTLSPHLKAVDPVPAQSSRKRTPPYFSSVRRLNPGAPQVARLCYPVSILTGPSQLCDLPLHLRFSDKHICHWFCGLPGSSRKILSEILDLDFSLRRSHPALGELGRVGISEGGHHSTGCFTQLHPIPSHWVWLHTIGMLDLRRTGLEGR